MSYENYEQALHALAQEDPRFIVMTAENRAAIRNLPELLGERFVDVGIAEQTMIGAAAGLALRGRIPVVHALSTFLTLRAFEFVRTDVGIPGLPVKLVGGFSGFISEANGPTHQAVEDVALMRGIPGMNVWCPADEEDMMLGMETIMRDPAPYYIRHNDRKAVAAHASEFQPGQAESFGSGTDVTLLTYGLLFDQCYHAADVLTELGFSVGLLNMRTLKPIDAEAILGAARTSRLLVIVEDHFKTGGLWSIVAEILVEYGVLTEVMSLALDGRWFKPGLMPQVLAFEGFTAEAIADKVSRRLQQNGQYGERD